MRSGAGRAVVLVAVLALASCGVPADGSISVIATTAIPTGCPGRSHPPHRPPNRARARVWFLGAELSLRAVALDAASSSHGVQAVLDRLATGPLEEERDDGLQTALGPDVRLRLTAVDAGVASVEVVAISQDPSADRLPLAVGQIVLSVASVPGVDG